ncbi:DUF5916 domain-containing protein [Gemmatimonadota bacterium]
MASGTVWEIVTMCFWSRLCAAALVFFLLPGSTSGQEPLAIARIAGGIEIDGIVDEPAWDSVPVLPAVAQTPTFGAPPSERTEFRLTYDDDHLYFSCRNYDSDVTGIRATSLRRDESSFSNDWCVINLDTFNDRETALIIGVSAAGVRTDAVFSNDALDPPNFSWNTFWDAAVSRDENGWYSEIRIPFSSLRFQDNGGKVVLGASFWRRIARKNEMITFPPISPQWGTYSVFKASQTRQIVLDGVYSRKPLYLTPYALGGVGRSHDLNDAETAYEPIDHTSREAGLDVKYGVTNNLTLDVTLNTDFAQVEADNQQVNLTRFSLFFPEKRLFFQERANIFEYSLGGVDRLFHSRRIGLVSGKQVRIYGGARLVGRIGRWDVGFLNMHSDAYEAASSENFGVLRLRRQVLNENSYVGGIVTSRIDTDGGYNVAYGLDGILRLFGQDFLTLDWSQTFEDDESVVSDPFERAFLRARWERRGQDGLTYVADVSRAGVAFHPGMGFLRRSDYVRIGDRISYGWRAGSESVLLRHTLGLTGFLFRRNEGGRIETAEIGPEWVVETKIGHVITLAAATMYDDLEDTFELSDNTMVPAGSYFFHSVKLAYSAPVGFLIRPDLQVEGGSFYDGWKFSTSITPTWNVSRHLRLSGRYGLDRVSFSERSQRFTAHIGRFRAEAMASSKFSVTAFIQYSSANDVAIANFRVRYNPREGTDLYVVYNEGRNTDRFNADPILPFVKERTLLVKYSYTFNLEF